MQIQVQPGDTLYGILRGLGVEDSQLPGRASEVATANGLSDPSRIRAGSMITIPDSFVRSSASSHSSGSSPRSSTPARATTAAMSALDVRATAAEPPPSPPSNSPTGNSISLTTAMKAVVGDANRRLDLDVMNESFNPLIETIGPYAEAGDVFRGKSVLPLRDIVSGAAAALPAEAQSALAPLLAKVDQTAVIFGPAHQYKLDESTKPGNRVVFYGGSIGHDHIDRLVQELGKQHQRVAKQMVHFNSEAQGGTVESILQDGVGGSTHVGGFSAGALNGKEASIKSDWPSSYGYLDDDNEDYNATLFAIDYQAGTRDPIPEAYLAAYKSNADMWDACAGMLVPFTDEELDDRYRDYMFNPLEVHDQASVQDVAKGLAAMDSQAFLEQHGAFYCAEGQYSVANLGPNALLQKKMFGDTPFGRLIDAFQQAPGLSKTHPEIGWQHLADQNLISQDQLDHLRNTDRTAVYLDWVPEDVKPWTEFRPFEKDGLIAKPMTVATMAWALFRSYLPREAIANAIGDAIRGAYKNAVLQGDVATESAVKILTGGQEPSSSAGRQALSAFALQAATGFLGKVASDEGFRDRLLAQAGFQEITNDADRNAVLNLYGEFTSTLARHALSSQADLDAAIRALDERFGNLAVERETYNKVTGEFQPARRTLMRYAAPQCFGFWAQQPSVFGDSHAIRYVATAMHAHQAKAGALAGA